MHDSVKQEIFAKYSNDPVQWNVPKLASVYGLSQPRVQAILLLKEWEKQDRAIGRVTEEHDRIEDCVHEAHLKAVRELEEQEQVSIRMDKYSL